MKVRKRVCEICGKRINRYKSCLCEDCAQNIRDLFYKAKDEVECMAKLDEEKNGQTD